MQTGDDRPFFRDRPLRGRRGCGRDRCRYVRRPAEPFRGVETGRRHSFDQPLRHIPPGDRGYEYRPLHEVWTTFKRVRRHGIHVGADRDVSLDKRGGIARLLNPLFRLVSNPIYMLPLGFLFGLGFDTATEISLLGISASQASHGLPIWSILVFPALFSAGITLVDTTDAILMLGVYDWSIVRPVHKLYYNLTITLISVITAVLVGGIEALALVGQQARLDGDLWTIVGEINAHFGAIGLSIVGSLVAAWLASYAIDKVFEVDRIDAQSDGAAPPT